MTPLQPPYYYQAIYQEAADLWDTLEERPPIAAPWHQLFRQIQSPRHVVSELLQNADDAGATEAWITIDDFGRFVFEHNGKDFTEEQFQSLCRFGYSNKRSLFTIGFRGIGFKSTFSLGSPVTVQTPSLSVEFHEHRFTEPSWISSDPPTNGLTRIFVQIEDGHRRAELEKNFQDWIDSPLSLLFFRHIRHIHFADKALHWHSQGHGPVKNSEWIELDGQKTERFLIVRSTPEPFPPEALEEIRKERMAPEGENQDFPPCTIDLVLGAEGRLFVVLPTGGGTGLPFCANAPFMLTPDREHIKASAISPVNRWLLQRAGRVAAAAMIEWLGNDQLAIGERAGAYNWMPPEIEPYGAPDKLNGILVASAFRSAIESQAFFLADDGRVLKAGEVIELPQVALQTWTSIQASALFDEEKRPALCRHVSSKDRKKLSKCPLYERVDDNKLLNCLSNILPPRPATWDDLFPLWSLIHKLYVAQRPVQGMPALDSLHILPVQGRKDLHSAAVVTRVTSRLEHYRSEKDWDFLITRLSVLDCDWIRFVAERDRAENEKEHQKTNVRRECATELLKELDLDRPPNNTKLLEQAAKAMTYDPQALASDWIRLAHIAATLGAETGDHFCFVTCDGEIRPKSYCTLQDLDGELETILPTHYADSHLIHESYSLGSDSCPPAEWSKWARSGKPGLTDLPGISETTMEFRTRKDFESFLANFQVTAPLRYSYATETKYAHQKYYLTDFDFPDVVVKHWIGLPEQKRVWTLIARRLLFGAKGQWEKFTNVRGEQTNTKGGNSSEIKGISVAAEWLRSLRTKACLPDRHGKLSLPTDLFRRTPETEGLLEVEPFVDAELDTEHTRDLLDVLGVVSRPPGPSRLLSCLEALTLAKAPPVTEIEKWYRRLDLFTANCSNDDLNQIADAFATKNLVRSQEGDWLAPSDIYIEADEADAPGVPLVMESVNALRLWERLEIRSRPTVDSVIEWLKELPVGKVADKLTTNRIEAMMKRHPVRIWKEVGHWLDLSGRWVAVDGLDHAMDCRQRITFSHLHEWVKQRVADLRHLPFETVASVPFSALIPLGKAVEDRMLMDAGSESSLISLPWLQAFGEAMLRHRLDDEERTPAALEIARRLAQTHLRRASSIQVTPYFEDKPAGTARQQEIAWIGKTLFSIELSPARLARQLPELLGRFLPTEDLKAALCYCYERPVEDILRYMEENFDLAKNDDVSPLDVETPAKPDYEPPVATPVFNHPENTTPPAEPEPPSGPPQDPGGDQPENPEPNLWNLAERKPKGTGLMERFAQARGFHRNGEGFLHADGSIIVKDREGSLGWRFQDAHSGRTRYLRAIDSCLDRNPLEIPYECWVAIEKEPSLHGLILIDTLGLPVELTGVQLCQMKQDGVVSLYPATYRLKRN